MSSGIHEIIISIRSNIPEKPTFELTSDIYYVPDENKETVKYNKYPFFTVNMRFPKSLHSKTQKQLKEVFFNKNNFESEINGDLAVTDEDRQANATYNMKLLMELLLPTSFPINNNYHISFDENITGTATSFQEIKTWMSYLVGSKQRFSSVRLGETNYSFTEITWANDIVNMTEYNQLFRKLNQFSSNSMGDSSSSIPNNEKEMETLKSTFVKEYTNSFYKLLVGTSSRKSKDGSDQTVLAEIIEKNDSATRVRREGVPPDEMNPLLAELRETGDDKSMEIFFSLMKLELNAKKASPTTFIPQILESLGRFRSLMNTVKKYYYLQALNENLKNLGNFMKIVNKKPDDMTNQWEVYVQSQFKNMKEVLSIVDMMKKYRKPNPSDKPKLTNYQYITNTDLQSLIDGFGKDQKGTQLETIAKEFGSVLSSKSKKVQLTSPKVFEVGIVIRTQSSASNVPDEKAEKKEEEEDVFGINKRVTYNVSLQAVFVKGLLTPEVAKSIKCAYANNTLIQRYDTLKNPRKNLYLLHNAQQPLIDIMTLGAPNKTKTGGTKRRGGTKTNNRESARKTRKYRNCMKTGGFMPKTQGKPKRKGRKGKIGKSLSQTISS